jgi:hypothetical protein
LTKIETHKTENTKNKFNLSEEDNRCKK